MISPMLKTLSKKAIPAMTGEMKVISSFVKKMK